MTQIYKIMEKYFVYYQMEGFPVAVVELENISQVIGSLKTIREDGHKLVKVVGVD